MSNSGDPAFDHDYIDIACSYCGPHRRSPINQKRKVMRVWRVGQSVETFHCARCGARGRLAERSFRQTVAAQSGTPAASVEQRMRLARQLWQAAMPIGGTLAERYLRHARSIGGTPPPTLRYLPASGRHPHAMIAALGLAKEISCGELDTPIAPPAVHLTRLAPDGLQRLDKIMMGPVSGHPIVLAPPNDGLGLVIAEGIEDALSLREATGLGAWAAGSATHLAKLAPSVPGCVAWVTLAEDDDDAGRKAVQHLAQALGERGFPVSIMSLARAA